MLAAVRLLLLLTAICTGFGAAHRAQAQIVYQANFESGASGWSNNRTESHPNFSRFLGRFDNSRTTTSRSFAVPAGSGSLEIAFDFYRFDSWDDTSQWGFDRWQVDINGVQILSIYPTSITHSGTSGTAAWQVVPVGPFANQAYGNWADQRFRVTITITNPPATVTLALRTALNQGGNDESGGYDNFLVRAFPPPPALALTKVGVPQADPAAFRLPGTVMLYTIRLTSTGGAIDAGSVDVRDILPPGLELFTGNFSAGTPVAFADTSAPASGITCCTAAMISFATGPAPHNFTYGPSGGYDPAVSAIRIVPSGALRQGVTSPVTVEFRLLARVR